MCTYIGFMNVQFINALKWALFQPCMKHMVYGLKFINNIKETLGITTANIHSRMVDTHKNIDDLALLSRDGWKIEKFS